MALPGGGNHVTGVNQFTYTAQFGNGVSGSFSAAGSDRFRIQPTSVNTSYATAARSLAVPAAATSFGGTRALLTCIAVLLLDQAWGLFKASFVAHNNHVSYYGTTESHRSPQ